MEVKMPDREFVFTRDAARHAKLEVGGLDLTRCVREFRIVCRGQEPAEITLILSPVWNLRVEVDGEIVLRRTDDFATVPEPEDDPRNDA